MSKKQTRLVVAVALVVALGSGAVAAPVTPEGATGTLLSWGWIIDTWNSVVSTFDACVTTTPPADEDVPVPTDDVDTTTAPPDDGDKPGTLDPNG